MALSVCIKCNQGGQLLACISDACHIRVHERCMSCVPALDENGKFTCPHCVYLHALSKCREIEKKVSLARIELQDFLSAPSRLCVPVAPTSHPGRLVEQQPQNACPPIPLIRRRRCLWTEEEEEMLKEGVQRFASADTEMPWTAILEFGREVFDKSRTSVDLKDKWRNMNKKRKDTCQ